MNNVRGLYPPLYGAMPSGGGGGGGGGQHIQVDTLPEASLANKNKIVQYVGATTETLTNAYFYKCVENTGYEWEETEASETYTEAETLPTASAETIGTIYKVDDKYYQTIIVLTYSWDNVDVQAKSIFTLEASITPDGTTDMQHLFYNLFSNITLNPNKRYIFARSGVTLYEGLRQSTGISFGSSYAFPSEGRIISMREEVRLDSELTNNTWVQNGDSKPETVPSAGGQYKIYSYNV